MKDAPSIEPPMTFGHKCSVLTSIAAVFWMVVMLFYAVPYTAAVQYQCGQYDSITGDFVWKYPKIGTVVKANPK